MPSLVAALPPIPLALFPVYVAWVAHTQMYPPPPPLILLRDVGLISVLVLILTLGLARLRLPPVMIGMGLSTGIGLLLVFPLPQILLGTFGVSVGRLFAFCYVVMCPFGASWIMRRQRANSALSSFFSALAVVLVALMLWQLWPAYGTSRPGYEWQGVESASSNHTRKLPDIYHIVLDGFGRPDVLQSRYSLDLSSFMSELRRRGFDAFEGVGFANYVMTPLSLGSMLNGTYIDGPSDSTSLELPAQMIARSSVVRSLKHLGYEFHYIGSDYLMTHRHPSADRCDCHYPAIGEFESSILIRTVINVTGLGGLDHIAHREKIRQAFAALESAPHSQRPRYVLAHIMAPHPPFVFDSVGASVLPATVFALYDGTAFRGSSSEYERGYRDQAKYISDRVLQLVDRLDERSREEGRQPLVIIHGDHGPRLRWHTVDARKTDPSESLPVFLGIRWAGGRHPQVPPQSLVNVYRAVFREYFDPSIEMLPDRAFVSSVTSPYGFLEVDVAPYLSAEKR